MKATDHPFGCVSFDELLWLWKIRVVVRILIARDILDEIFLWRDSVETVLQNRIVF